MRYCPIILELIKYNRDAVAVVFVSVGLGYDSFRREQDLPAPVQRKVKQEHYAIVPP